MRKYYLKNLDCPRCTADIEAAVKKLGGVRFVSVNLATGTMHLDADDVSLVLDTIRRIEPRIEVSNADDGAEPEERSYIRRELAVILLSAALFIPGMFFLAQLHHTPMMWAEYAVFIAAYLLCGWNVLWRAARNLASRRLFDETFLMSIATIGAIAIHKLPEAVGVMLFYKIGEFLQELSVKRSRRSITSLLEIRPEYATRRLNGELVRVPPEDVAPGEIIVVKPGEKIPLDGVVDSGSSFADTSTLTGESVPRTIHPGDTVLSGMINTTGVLEITVTRRFGESSVAKILDLVEHASGKKAETEKFITTFARYYTPIVVAGAVGVAFIPPLLLAGASLSEWVYRALVLLVISCPCALMISIPLGYFGGVGGASRRGILVKGANYLDALCKVKTVVYDKTGTLTRGVFKVTAVVPANGYTAESLIAEAAAVESQSNHPIAQSIREAYGKELSPAMIEGYEEIAGTGVRARVDGRLIIAGNDRILHQEDIAHDVCNVVGTVIHVAVDGLYAGYIVISDEVRPDARGVSKKLKALGVRSVQMLTGDEHSVAESVAHELELDAFHAELLPEEKVAAIEEIMAKSAAGELTAFVGDGINDAPVIARADVGIAMGGLGSDAAIDTADVVIMTDMPSKMTGAIEMGRKTRRIVWQNIVLALGVKGIFIAAGIIGIASMWSAVFADVGVALLAVFNATRVLGEARD